jgi:hypothetical protein
MTTYIPVVQVRVNPDTGDIIFATPGIPAVNATENPDWGKSYTIYQLQQRAFDKLKQDLVNAAGSGTPVRSGVPAGPVVYESPELKVYYKAIQNIIQFNKDNGGGSGTKYFIAFFNSQNGNNLESIEKQYSHLVEVRNALKAQVDNLHSKPWTINSDYDEMYRQSIYTNTLVAIAAVSLLYLAFIHL